MGNSGRISPSPGLIHTLAAPVSLLNPLPSLVSSVLVILAYRPLSYRGAFAPAVLIAWQFPQFS